MQPSVPRYLAEVLRQDLTRFPAVVLLGPRQCGKTTLVQALGTEIPGFMYRDLERPQDLRQLDDPEFFLEGNLGSCLCLDEIQRLPGLFPVLRGFIDRHPEGTRLLLLGSASPDLLKHSAESLAGRVVYRELSPLLWDEVDQVGDADLRRLWLRGGFPRSYLASSERDSSEWLQAFVRTIVERDFPALGLRISPVTLGRFMRMLALNHGQSLNLAALGNSLGATGNTIRHYLDLLEGTYHVRLLSPWQTNQGKRLVKTPKVYFRDSGVLHSLWEVGSFNALLGHPLFGASWEGFVLEHVQARFPQAQFSYYRTATGVEIDLVLELGGHRIAIEAKASSAPNPTKGFWTALADLSPTHSFVVAPVEAGWPIRAGVEVVTLGELLEKLGGALG